MLENNKITTVRVCLSVPLYAACMWLNERATITNQCGIRFMHHMPPIRLKRNIHNPMSDPLEQLQRWNPRRICKRRSCRSAVVCKQAASEEMCLETAVAGHRNQLVVRVRPAPNAHMSGILDHYRRK